MITTDRDNFVGVHVRDWVKDSLREEATKRKCSVSKLVSDILEVALREKGYKDEGSDN